MVKDGFIVNWDAENKVTFSGSVRMGLNSLPLNTPFKIKIFKNTTTETFDFYDIALDYDQSETELTPGHTYTFSDKFEMNLNQMTNQYIQFEFNNTKTNKMQITAPGSASMYMN